MTSPVDRNAERQDPQGLGPKDESDGALQAQAPNTPAILSLDSPSLGEGVEAHALRDALDKLGYTKVFRAIGDAVKWREHRGIEISVEQLIFALTGIDQDNARYLTKIRSEEVATSTTNAPVDDREAVDAQVEMICRRYGLHRGDATKANQARGAIREALSLTKNVATNADMRGALEAIDRIVEENIVENDRPDRVLWKGQWIDGAAAEMVHSLLRAMQRVARTVLQGDQP